MKYVVFATVRIEHDEWSPTRTEVFIGDVKEHEHPTRVAYRGVADLNNDLRVEDRKWEIVGTTWFEYERMNEQVVALISKFMLVEKSPAKLFELEETLDRLTAKVFSKLEDGGYREAV